tara:strand:- start:17624 stop:17887 length:264 start_codon:yes stop_codon:yes gene_type:complete
MKTKVLKANVMDHSQNEEFSHRVDSPTSAKEIFDYLLQVHNWWTRFHDATINLTELQILPYEGSIARPVQPQVQRFSSAITRISFGW